MAAMLIPSKGMPVALDRNNRIFVLLFALCPGLLASGTSFLVAAAFFWAVFSVVTGRFPVDRTQSDRAVLICMSAYPIVMIASVLINDEPMNGLKWIVRVLPFLALWFVLPRLRQSPDGRLMPILLVGAGVGMIGTFILCVIQMVFFLQRAEGGAGNAAVLGLLTVLFGSISLLNAGSTSRVERFIAIGGFAAGFACAFLSGTRSAWLVMPIHVLIMLWYFNRQRLGYSLKGMKIGLAAVAIVTLFLAVPKVIDRIDALEQDVTQLESDPDAFSSLNARLVLWGAAADAIAKDPLTGYGPQNRMKSVVDEVSGPMKKHLKFTHVHNGFLNAAVDAGILGSITLFLLMMAPIVGAWKKQPGPGRDLSLALAFLLVASYFVTGTFGIMFGHDATDAIFVFMTGMICLDRGTTKLVSVDELARLASQDKAVA